MDLHLCAVCGATASDADGHLPLGWTRFRIFWQTRIASDLPGKASFLTGTEDVPRYRCGACSEVKVSLSYNLDVTHEEARELKAYLREMRGEGAFGSLPLRQVGQ